MPGFDTSGPLGQGPMSGGARGICGTVGSSKTRENRYQSHQYSQIDRSGPGCRRGFTGRRSRTMGAGFGRQLSTVDNQSLPTQNNKKEVFDNQLNQIQQSLSNIGQRLDAIEKKLS